MRRTSSAATRWATTATLLAIAVLASLPSNVSTVVAAVPLSASTVELSFGSNANGKTGLGTTSGNTLVATQLNTTNLAGRMIAQVTAGQDHSLLLGDDGTVLSFGANFYGRTGLGTTSGSTVVATPIDTTNLAGRTIVRVAAGGWHSLVLADDGTVFSFGNNSFGQTGLGTSGDTLIATPIDTSNLAGKRITQVAAGVDFSLLLADDGTVFSFGSNSNGRTGLGTATGNTLIATPIDMTNLAERRITQVAAGFEHSLLLADDGTVFSFGWNGRGQTGRGTTTGNTLVAAPVDTTNLAGRTVMQVAAGAYHSLLLADDGTVFSFGWNIEGQAGLGTMNVFAPVATPIDTTNLAGRTITQITGGLNHSLLLADDGRVFSFGANDNGQTGLGTDIGKTRVAMPIDTTHLMGLRITDVSAGSFYSLLVAVPEPGGATLLILAGLSLLMRRRCR